VLDVFLDVIAPVLVVALVGGQLARRFGLPVGPLSKLSFYLLGPALVFDALSKIEVTGADGARIAAVVIVSYVTTLVIGYGGASLARLDRGLRSAVGLTAATSNGGNMGLPVALLAFGDSGLEVAVLAFVVLSVASNSLGIVVASLAGGSARRALVAPLLVPSLWAAAAGLFVNAYDVDVPTTIEASAATLRGAAIPVMLVVLGLHLSSRPRLRPLTPLGLSLVTRLAVGPLASWAAVEAFDITGVTRNTLILLGGMPTAVVTTIIATQYRVRPDFVTQAVITSTLVSVATVTVLVTSLS
jgi:predicted permease